MVKTEALIKTLEIYSNTDSYVTQGFYQGLCDSAKNRLQKLQDENDKLKKQIQLMHDNGLGESWVERFGLETMKELLRDAKQKLTLPIYTDSEIALMKPLVDRITEALKGE